MPTIRCPSCLRALSLPEHHDIATACCPLCRATFDATEAEWLACPLPRVMLEHLDVTETEWLACQVPWLMLEHLRASGRASDRKFRLWACACVRRVWGQLHAQPSRHAVEVAERYADGEATEQERAAAYKAADSVLHAMDYGDWRQSAARAASEAAMVKPEQRSWWSRAPGAAESAARAVPSAIGKSPEPSSGQVEGYHEVRWPGRHRPLWLADELLDECAVQSDLLRDVFGNPFRPSTCDPAWRTPDTLALAQAAYEERQLPAGTLDATRLAVLADALEEAGCSDRAMLSHLREPGPHVRGCWVVDLILNRG
jgi:hypothetical protein